MLSTLNDEEWRLARLERLGLKEDPFKLSADPRYLYLGPEHLAVYRQAQGVISRRRGLALITGEMGMGKSSLARRLYDVYASEPSVDICYIHTAAFNQPWMLPADLRGPGHPDPRSLQRQMESLERMMADTFTRRRNVIILLDDAQLMVPEALEVLHRCTTSITTPGAHVLAFGQREMAAVFETNKAVNARCLSAWHCPR